MGSYSNSKRKYKRALFTGDINTAIAIAVKHPFFINTIIYPSALITPVATYEGHDTTEFDVNVKYTISYEPVSKIMLKDKMMCDAQQHKTRVVEPIEEEAKLLEEMTDAELEELAKKKIAEGLSISQGEIKPEE